MTPEEIRRQAAARNAAGQSGEAVARARPALAPPAPAQALSTLPQPAEVRGTAKPVPRPQPTISVDSQGNAATQGQRLDQATQQRMAAERSARLGAMNSGGIGALDDVVRQQQGPAGAARANLGATAPAAAAPAATAAQGPAYRAGQATQRVLGAAGAGARLGAAPVNPAAVGGKLAQVASVPGALATTGIASGWGTSLGTGTDDYYRRLMINPKDRPEGALGVLADTGVRTVGAVSDLGAGLLDIGAGAVNFVRGIGGAQPIEGFRDILTGEERGARPADQATPAAAPAAPAAPDIEGLPVSTAASRPQAAQPAAAQPEGRVLGEINGRQIREQTGQPDALGTSGLAANPNNLYRPPEDNGQGRLNAQQAQARSDRMNVQSGANQRLGELYKGFNDQIRQGRRRTAGVIGEQIRAELGVLGQTASGQMIDPRRPDTSAARTQAEAEAGRLGEATAGQRLENQGRQRLAQLESTITDPEATDEQRAQAATQYQLLTGRGGQQQAEGRIVQLPGEDGFTQVPALLPPGSTQAIPITTAGQQQKQPVGQARGPDGKTYNVFSDGSTELAQ